MYINEFLNKLNYAKHGDCDLPNSLDKSRSRLIISSRKNRESIVISSGRLFLRRGADSFTEVQRQHVHLGMLRSHMIINGRAMFGPLAAIRTLEAR